MSVALKFPRFDPKSFSRVAVIGVAALFLQAEAASAASITVTATIRDFSSSHADFEQGFAASETGIVLSALGPDGKPVYNEAVKGITGAASTTTNGTANFNQWYNDTPGVNTTFTTTLTATETSPGSGLYEYINGSYFPAGAGNFHFTTEINTEFTFVGDETFSFTGDDDVWVFINGILAIDLGGVHGPASDSITLNAGTAAFLGMTIGETYDLDIFHAELQTTGPNFNFTTSIVLVDAPVVPEPGAIALLGLGMGGLVYLRRRKNV